VEQASNDQLEKALSAAEEGFKKFRKLSRAIRSKLLIAMADEIERRRSEFVERLILEAGKPRSLSEVEVSRAIGTFQIAAEEVRNFGGELIPVDRDLGGKSYQDAEIFFRPRGPVLGITPFNFPLNLVAHKVAPALAVGTSILLKPPPQAPSASALLAEVFEKAARAVSDSSEAIPLSAFQMLSAPNDVMARALEDPRLSILSFTGSHQVGWSLRDRAKKKKVLLELGGNAAVIVHSDADLKRAASRIAFGGYAYAGQVCISVQRVFVQASVASEFKKLLVAEIEKLKVGDPSEKDTVVGPLIDAQNADRVESWVKEAVSDGAQILCGGKRSKNLLHPILITKVKAEAKISCDEVFGPVVVLDTYEKFEDAISRVNESPFGLQAGVFTDSARLIDKAIDALDVGGVLINEIPTYRADHLPYGGSKDSGLGREGLRYSMQEYSELKTVVRWKSPGGLS
jgi:glyceraldehyde-3-phosphate dehydrogenase (NADP+)